MIARGGLYHLPGCHGPGPARTRCLLCAAERWAARDAAAVEALTYCTRRFWSTTPGSAQYAANFAALLFCSSALPAEVADPIIDRIAEQHAEEHCAECGRPLDEWRQCHARCWVDN